MTIEEFPYSGTITRELDGEVVQLYNGVMDISLNTPEVGTVAQTANYIVSLPYNRDANATYVIPQKDDKITVSMLGDNFILIVNLSIPSQLGGVTVYASRGDF